MKARALPISLFVLILIVALPQLSETIYAPSLPQLARDFATSESLSEFTLTIYLIGFDPRHSTPVRGGENGGRVLPETNVVRSFAAAGSWSGVPLTLVVPAPEGERAAVLLQAADGRILAAATLP